MVQRNKKRYQDKRKPQKREKTIIIKYTSKIIAKSERIKRLYTISRTIIIIIIIIIIKTNTLKTMIWSLRDYSIKLQPNGQLN